MAAEGGPVALANTPDQLQEKPDERSSTPQRHFLWDSIVKYAAFSIVALVAVNTVIQLLRNTQLACNLHYINTTTVSDALYIESYCYGELPRIQWLPVFNVVVGTLVVVPHYLWLNFSTGKFALFFTLAKQLNPLPDSETGIWSDKNLLIVERVEEVYGYKYGRFGSFMPRVLRSVVLTYLYKTAIQLLISILGLVTATVFFGYQNCAHFYCPKTLDNSSGSFWPLIHQVECTYDPLNSLAYLRIVDMILLSVAIFGLCLAFMDCVFFQPSLVHSRKAAHFTLKSSLDQKFYISHSMWESRMKHDLDFMIAQLFRDYEDLAYNFLRIQNSLRRSEITDVEMASVSVLRRYKYQDHQSSELLP